MSSVAPNPLRHPRRFGFVIFNAVVIVVLVAWLGMRAPSAEAGLAGLPNLALTTAGIIVLSVVWVGSWLAWGAMVWSRRRARENNIQA
jgi:hypothetical protein